MTRSIVTLAFLVLALSADRALAQDHGTRWPHFRSSVPELLDALVDGVRQSPTLRDLVGQLDNSDVVVYLGNSIARRHRRPRATFRSWLQREAGATCDSR